LLLCPLVLGHAALGAHPCEGCHSREVSGFAQSAMANSLRRPAKEPEGSFQAAGKTFTIVSGETGLLQKMERGGETAQFPVAYLLGSGKHGTGYLIRMGSELFQSPIGYYPSRKAYDLAPGFENNPQPDFTRPVTEECLLCHSGKVLHVAGTVNRYEQPAFADEGISCERCHGSAERHLKNPVPGSIVNPARLDPAARDSVCEQCHLSGVIRVANPGKRIADFRPGQRLEEIFTTYVTPADSTGGDDAFKSISHAEQLALSACARNSKGKLWCGTCHDPHNPAAETPAWFAGKCLSCHRDRLAVSVKAGAHPAGADCTGCHMSRRNAKDSAHSVFTDHRIQIRPGSNQASNASDLAPWRQPEAMIAQRNLALAYLNLGMQKASEPQVTRGERMLTELRAAFPDDPSVLTGLGTALLHHRQPRAAMADFERVAQLSPEDVVNLQNLGQSCLAAGDLDCAAKHFEKALDLNPLLLPVANNLTLVYRRQGNAAKLSALSQRMREAIR
jgi:Tfp pilus assembly protein PilF